MKKKTKLNLGSGSDYRKGYINIDINPDSGADIIADLQKRLPFHDNSVDEVLASDVLEHFTKERGKKFLEECHRILKINGIITIRTHNIFQIFEQFRDDPSVLIHFIYGDTEEGGIYGAHKFAYTQETIEKILKITGFKLVSFEKETTNFLIKAKSIKIDHNKKFKIGVVQQSPDIGGAEMFMISLLAQFKQKGHSVLMATNGGKYYNLIQEKLKSNPYKIPFVLDIMGNAKGLIKSMLLLPYMSLYYIFLLREFKDKKVDVILMSNFTEKLLVTFLSPFFNIPVVWIEYGSLKPAFKRNFYFPKLIYRVAKSIPKVIIVPTEHTKKSLIQDARVSLSKIMVIPCGVTIPHRIKKEKIPEMKNKFVIGNMSRLTKEKGQAYLLKAMPEILKKIPNAHLLLIGDGPDKTYFQKLSETLKIKNHVTITGFVKNKNLYLSSMNIFVFPTIWEWEGFGLVMIEAMMCKIPVIASSLGPVPYIIKNDKTGMLTSPGDSREIAKKVIELFKNKDKSRYLAQNGYDNLLKNYDIKQISNRFINILTEAML